MEFVPAIALIVLGTIAMQYAHATRLRDPNPLAMDRISRALSFIDLRKPSKAAPTCIALCNSPSDALTLIAGKAILIPFARTSMTLSFSPTKDPFSQAHQSPETAAALPSHRDFFFQGGLALTVTASISLPPDVFFNLVLLTLTSYA
jgi:hypothetical protein